MNAKSAQALVDNLVDLNERAATDNHREAASTLAVGAALVAVLADILLELRRLNR